MSTTIVQYIIIRGDLMKTLSWPLGALIAQACHATTAVNHLFQDDPETTDYLKKLDTMHKVCLEVADESELIKISEKLKQNGIKFKLWIEQPENIPTCLAIKPYTKEQVHPFVKKLKLLK